MNALRSLYARFAAYHASDRPMLVLVARMGFVAFPLLYLLRFSKAVPPYDDLWLRLAGMLLCGAIALRARWPRRLQPYFMAFSYLALLYCLPVFVIYTSLMNGGGVVAVANTMMALFFVVLLTDWRNTLVMLALGTALAAGLYLATAPAPALPLDYVARVPIMLLLVLGGSLFKFTEKQAELQKLERSYAALAASIAHEMRNPLSQIKHGLHGMQQALRSPQTQLREQQLRAALADSELAVQRGLRVIAMILDEVRAKPVDPAGFALIGAGDATRKAVHEYAWDDAAHRARVSVEVRQDFSFRGEETAYLFVLFNLLKNALYYVVPTPHASVRIVVEDGCVRVRDTGPGMAPQVLATLFEPFRSTGKSGGTGLGLAYCRRVMHNFGGEITCESVLGQYTQFTLRFPPVGRAELQAAAARLAQAPRQDVAPPAAVEMPAAAMWAQVQVQAPVTAGAEADAAPQDLAGCTILVADDSAWNRRIAVALLAQAGARVAEAAHGAAVLDYVRGGAPCDAVLMDLQMPGMDGLEAARVLRARGHPAWSVPLVALTGHADADTLRAARAAGIDEVLLKPIDAPVLQRTLRRLIDARTGKLALLVEQIAQAHASGNFEQALQVMQALLGLAEQGGGTPLYHFVKNAYTQMRVLRQWPGPEDWTGHLRALVQRTAGPSTISRSCQPATHAM